MKTIIPKKVPGGLRVELGGDPPVRRLKADQGGIYFWDKRSIVLEDLGEYLAKVEVHSDHVVFSKLEGSKEVAGNSVALRGRKLRRVVHDGLARALQAFRQRLDQKDLDADARRLIEAFKLPNPVLLPEFYRLHRGTDGEEHLIILWGCDRSEEESVRLEDVPLLLGKRSYLVDWVLRNKKALAAAAGALLVLLLLLLILAWPASNVVANKAELSVGEGCVISFPDAQGRSFSLDGRDAFLQAARSPWAGSQDGSLGAQLPNSPLPITKPELGSVECRFSSPGRKMILFSARTRFLGIELPTRTKDLWVTVRDIPESDDVPADVIIDNRGQDLLAEVTSPSGVFPAVVEFRSPVGGEIGFGNGDSGLISAGDPLVYRGYSKPGSYKVSVSDPSSGLDRVSYLQVPPGDGDYGLVPNLRLSKEEAQRGERLVVDTSSSYHADPKRSIVSKRISLDGGESFQELEGSYAVFPATRPGEMEVVLEVEDDAGETRRDSASVMVKEEESPPLPDIKDVGPGPLPRDLGGVEIPNDLLFERGKAELSPSGAAELRKFANKIAKSQRGILIVGHTDDLPIIGELRKKFPNNKALSVARARAAADVMRRAGVPAERIQVEGKGDADPVSRKKTEEARALNRRIQVFFLD